MSPKKKLSNEKKRWRYEADDVRIIRKRKSKK